MLVNSKNVISAAVAVLTGTWGGKERAAQAAVLATLDITTSRKLERSAVVQELQCEQIAAIARWAHACEDRVIAASSRLNRTNFLAVETCLPVAAAGQCNAWLPVLQLLFARGVASPCSAASVHIAAAFRAGLYIPDVFVVAERHSGDKGKEDGVRGSILQFSSA